MSADEWFFDCWALLLVLWPAYRLAPGPRTRSALLSLTGAYLLFLRAPRMLLFFLAYWLAMFVLHRAIAATLEKRIGRAVFALALGVALAPMLWWKIAGDSFEHAVTIDLHALIWDLNTFVGGVDALRGALIPIGLSFTAFRAADLAIRTRIQTTGAQPIDRILAYGLFPPTLAIGPIAQYDEIENGLAAPPPGWTDFREGVARILVGLVKVYVLAWPLRFTPSGVTGATELETGRAWLALFAFAWYFYFNFAGYSDLAIGTARILGFKLRENFNYPFFQRDLPSFWNCWHMTLSHFVQRNIFVPIGGYRRERQYIALIASIMTIALWHDITWGWVVFGLYHAAGMCTNRWIGNRRRRLRVPAPTHRARIVMSTMATFTYVMLSMPLLVIPLSACPAYYLHLFGLGGTS